MQAVQSPVIPVVAELIRSVPGTISLGQGVVGYGPPREAIDELSLYLKLQPNAVDASKVAKDLQAFRAQLEAIQASSAPS